MAAGRARPTVEDARQFAHIVTREREDAGERVRCLRMQAEAWRLLAMIALREPDYARAKARWLFFVSVPFVDGPAVQGFIDTHRDRARACGIAAGVFHDPSTVGQAPPVADPP